MIITIENETFELPQPPVVDSAYAVNSAAYAAVNAADAAADADADADVWRLLPELIARLAAAGAPRAPFDLGAVRTRARSLMVRDAQ
jgi:hypothetical protein